MSSKCTNCNIQNSSSEYQGSQGEIGIKILPPRKRYNPAFFNASTASSASVKATSTLASAVSDAYFSARDDERSKIPNRPCVLHRRFRRLRGK